jgi:hypothetical protein
VYANGKRWCTHISYDNKKQNLGTFDTKQEAALAYDRKARQCREDMKLNYESNKAAEEKARQCGEDKPLNYESIKAAEEAAVQAQAEYTLVHNMCAGPQQPKPRPASGFYGVSARGKRWAAYIHYDSKKHYLGSFDTKQEAALAYDMEARQCGEDRLLNYESVKAAEEAVAAAHVTIFADVLCAGPQQPKPRPPSGFYGVYASR